MINGNATYSYHIRARFRMARVLCCVPILALASASASVVVRRSTEDKNFAKSSAQVATLVSPQVVSPKSCELKLGRYRPYRIMGRFSKQEKENVEAAAKAAGLSINEYVRYWLLGKKYDPTVRDELRRANLELTRQGSNLNQLAKLRNSGKASIAEEDGMLGVLARSMLPTHKAVRDALVRGKEPEP